ncbi:hypothetical protein NEMIN01_1774 [Nematocida minor]|uniref:uncharacterized protein n=1 Tax=Nematocida minor TaxID=1912983 RepID=UPI00221EA418|nr:uncharacterized protein NEMIN01_1774 [Nematocida minor]KAI5191990.1 hypothetical protein NEMIN01_1774 [Nematocida minor]
MSKLDPEKQLSEVCVDLNPNEPAEIEQPCISCGGPGVLRLLIVPDMFFPDALVSTFTCKSCSFRNKQMDEMDTSLNGVRITCSLDKTEDLRRYLIVPARAKIRLDSGERGVSYVQTEDTVTTVEALLRGIFEKLISMGSMPEDKLTEEELAGLGEYSDIAVFLQKSMDDLDIVLSIEDDKGVARVMPLGANMQHTTKGVGLEYYRDGVVEIEEYEVKKVGETPEHASEEDREVDI